MSTRSLTVLEGEKGQEIAVLYRHMDGYPTGHGADLKEFLTGFTIVNGLGSKNGDKTANGADCLAAQIVAHFKTEPGNIYLNPAGTRDMGEEYIYTIRPMFGNGSSGINLKVESGEVTYFGLSGTKQANMAILYEGPIQDFDPVAIEKGT